MDITELSIIPAPGYSGLTDLSQAITEIEPGRWEISIPPTCTIGRYEMQLRDSSFSSDIIETMDLGIIFKLPSGLLAEDEISAFCYDEKSVTKNEFDYTYQRDGSGGTRFDLRSFASPSPEMPHSIVEYALAATAGTVTPFDAASRLYRLTNQRIEWDIEVDTNTAARTGTAEDPYNCENYFSYNGPHFGLSPENPRYGDEVLSLTLEKAALAACNNYDIDEGVTEGYTNMIIGNCGDFSAMLTTLSRSVGIPSQINSYHIIFGGGGVTGTLGPGGNPPRYIHWVPTIWLVNPPLEDILNPPHEQDWYVFDPQDNYYSWHYKIGDFPVSAIDPSIDYYRAFNLLDGPTLEHNYACDITWYPGYNVKNRDISSEIDLDSHFDLSVDSTITGHLSFGDRDYFRLDLTDMTDAVTVQLLLPESEYITAEMKINFNGEYPYTNAHMGDPDNLWNEDTQTWTYLGVDWMGTSLTITESGIYYIMVDANMPDDADRSGQWQYGNYGEYQISVTAEV